MLFNFFKYPIDMLYYVKNNGGIGWITSGSYIYNQNYSDGFLCILGFICAILTALVFHELAHGFVAFKCGDDTAKRMGRLTLNPLKHLDPIGTLCMIIVGFGWAKPVPINPVRFNKYRRDMRLVSLAGVTYNLIFSFLSLGLFRLVMLIAGEVIQYEDGFVYYLIYFLYAFFGFSVLLNINFMLFNLIPIPPLDGFRFIETFMSGRNKFGIFMNRYGSFVLLGLIALGFFGLDILGLYIGNVSRFIIGLFDKFWTLFL